MTCNRNSLAAVLTLAILLAIAGPAANAQSSSNPPRPLDLSRLVVVGDSLSAGYQNGSLLDSQQANGYAAVIARQAGAQLDLPLMAAPGIPNVLQLASVQPLVIVPVPGISTGRTNPFTQPTNVAVPGHRVGDALAPPGNILAFLILGVPGPVNSQIGWAEALRPSTAIIWLGNNDALVAALFADPAVMTPLADFQAAYAQVMDRLAATGAQLVVGNIADVIAVPYLTSAYQVAQSAGAPLAYIGPALGISSGDYVTPDAFPLIQAILTGQASGPLPAGVVLTAAEVEVVRQRTADYNAVIAQQAAGKGAVLVDIAGLLAQLSSRGRVVGGQRLTTNFLGGLFSLDGIHPTNTGYAVVANEFIHAMNAQRAAGIPPANIEAVASSDPLIFPGVGRPSAALGHVSPAAAASLRAAMGHR